MVKLSNVNDMHHLNVMREKCIMWSLCMVMTKERKPHDIIHLVNNLHHLNDLIKNVSLQNYDTLSMIDTLFGEEHVIS
jgi:hypothetical protein